MFERLIPSMKVIFNSRTFDTSAVPLDLANRAFCYGDGLFETIVTGPERFNLIDFHLARLQRACHVLNIKFPRELKATFIEASIKQLQAENELSQTVRTKIMLWRNTGGLYSPSSTDASYLIEVKNAEKPFFRNGGKLGLSESVHTNFSPISFAKTMSSMPYVLAGIEKNKKAIDEIILTDVHGNIAETHLANVFWINGSNVFTPDLTTGCIEGVMRKQLIALFAQNGHKVNTGKFTVDALQKADSIFASNASGISYFSSFLGLEKSSPKPPLKELIPQLPL
ncbi:hypothetical protein GBO34_00240 [Roseivirga pacifica]|nr:hypothetical protein [Roseivirga pacifica]MCO6367741.1 hypothetical protein [Roseivirga pacifica]MCO6369727.1 hypothetical protein [Roseivirga pacifica]MCO6373581.1 hypothetical protein [Roseivirga pacifica]MCO6377114.1 hypothetical protein [Roseivirga pacifica]